ncbi:beta-1,3-galactosyl-O-glycosyl-glycoprotein beta-1,6-N-acetylglucosaminyltransferase 3 [Octopus bimaculoides]|uniref:Uncharacterized protein n=1 Tax=Octopus bimaculoides TaxID=37653 RepID=A0A0L8FZM4_OCTBM|nr:beta-1,3-galactosyl-O-glycosyl-glycoprotein beta-1,6-N-acetylglucosaminyltransferase 3 [Octopus bimaculoides]|eukprot:XP_014785428.1 PREDICTED: beta-1,3-galactosyl-O-glycosyl-glycoprotein beta-1,6-N-acetylglucosaminyltransferase 3-like [Octopus bimaculoides]
MASIDEHIKSYTISILIIFMICQFLLAILASQTTPVGRLPFSFTQAIIQNDFTYKTNDIDCDKVISVDEKEIKRSLKFDKRYEAITLKTYMNWTLNCEKFRQVRHYDKYIVSVAEKEFPIAYSIVFHKDLEQLERLLRSIYRRHNVYCLHVDKKANKEFMLAVKALANCFDNVFIASKLETVVYASMSRLQADFNCMQDLLKTKTQWKYLINLCGQSFPLKTNSEIVKILKIYNGSNDIEGLTNEHALLGRAKFKHKIIKKSKTRDELILVKTKIRQPDPPHKIRLVKGSAYGVFSRDFVYYVSTSNISKNFQKWVADVYSPDEFFWSTLHHAAFNPHLNVPGSYSGHPESKLWLAAYSAWQGVDLCYGKWKRGVCIFSTKDLPNIFKKNHLFANKFYLHSNPTAIECLEEILHKRTITQAAFNDTFYRHLKFINS